MIDVMHQKPEKKKIKNLKTPQKGKDKDKGKDATCFAQSEKDTEEKDRASYCCGNEDYLLPRCPDNNTLSKEKWAKLEL